MTFLGWLGKGLPAIGGVLIADFWLYRWYKREPLRQRYQFKPGMKLARINWVGWLSAAVATYVGGWLITWGIACINALVIGLVLYIVIALICDKAGVSIGVGERIIDETGA